jgi:glycerol-3-phosphate acyltransferase PlsY
MKTAALIIACYLIGSIPFSYIFSKLLGGVDIRKRGSRNVGATNVLRTAGVKVAIPAFAGDLLKGVAACWLGALSGDMVIMAVCAVMAVIGHCWPIFLGLKGGKGVATSAGIILYLSPMVFISVLAVFILVVVLSKYVSLGSISAAVLFPVSAVIFDLPRPLVLMSLVLAVLVVSRHHRNISNLINGTEAKLTGKTSS